MKAKEAILAIVATVVLLSTLALAQSGGQPPPSSYAVGQGTASGGGYHLTSLRWQVSGNATGAAYCLYRTGSPVLRGSGCCCTYLPLVVKDL